MPDESPESLERIATQIEVAQPSEAPRNRALYWYLVIVCFMPATLCILFTMLIIYLIRETTLPVEKIGDVGLVVVFCLIVWSSIFALGLIHASIHDALYHRDTAKSTANYRRRVVQFICLQFLATAPMVIKFVGDLSGVIQ